MYIDEEVLRILRMFGYFCGKIYENESDELITYNDVKLDEGKVNMIISKYYLEKYKKDVEVSFVKLTVWGIKQNFVQNYPCVVLKEFYDGDGFNVTVNLSEYEKNAGFGKNEKISDYLPSYVHVLYPDEIKKIFEINGYYEADATFGMFDLVSVKAKKMTIISTGRVIV